MGAVQVSVAGQSHTRQQINLVASWMTDQAPDYNAIFGWLFNMDVDVTARRISGMQLKGEDEEPSDEDREKFNQLVAKAKKYVGEGHIEKALQLNQQALKICYHEKLAKKIRKMEEYIKAHADDSSDDEDESGMMHLGKGFYLYKDLFTKLYSHQQEGVLWLWSLFRRKKGGILGDDMGLGKTIQVIGFLSGMFDMQKVRSVLIVLPVALMVNWEKEIEKWAPGLKVVAFHGSSKREKERALARVQRRGGICLTTYGLVVTSWEQLGTQDGREFVWDYMILDEGHKIKNPTKTSKGVHAIPASNRIILTGTPVQNNLKELWALFDFVHQGSLLGTQRTFKMEYDNPITRAREKDATVGEKKLGMEMAESLKKIIAPYFLRRTKAEVKERENKENEDPKGQAEHAVMPTMTRKNDLIVWAYLTETQLKIYQDFLSLDSVKELLMTTKSPLVALNVLKKICDHPRLLSTRACVQLGIDGDEGVDEDFLETEAGNLSAVTRIQHVDDNILINEAGKLIFLVKLLDQLKEEGHRCLVFSQSRKMLDIMEKVITNRGHKIMRLDGTIAQVQEREQRIRKFQTDNSYSVFLLTTQVGGVGLTLTAADRVVIYDPSWNPATDAQAVDRVFRIGQDKNVVIYRLITCGTVEEKIYRRQVFKDSITKQTTGASKNPYRYFSKYELKELFTMDDPHTSTTQQQLEQMHGGQRNTDTHLDEHLAFLYSLGGSLKQDESKAERSHMPSAQFDMDMFGISDHDLMFSQGSEGGNDQDDEGEESPENNYIQHRVQKARELIQMESSQGNSLDERLGKAPSGGAGLGGGGGPRNWDFPKPEPHPQSPPVKEEIDLTHHSTPDVTVDLTSPRSNNRETSEEGSSMDDSYASNEDEHSVMDQSMQSPQIKREVVDLTASPGVKHESNPYTSTHGVKHEPMEESNSPFIKREPNNFPQIKREPIDLTSTPNNTDMLTENTESGMNLSNKRTPLSEKKINTNLFGIVGSPDVEDLSKSLNSSAGSKSSHSSSKPIVEDSPDRSSLNSYHSNRTRSNPTDISMNESMMNSVIVNDSVIMSDTEENDGETSAHHTNISVQEVRSILEKSLCSNLEEFNRSHVSSVHDSPVVNKSKRRSVCVRRVIESSEEEDEDVQDQEDEANSASETEDLENDMESLHENNQSNNPDDIHHTVYNEYEGNMYVNDLKENTDIHETLEEEIRTDMHKSLEEGTAHTDIHKSMDENIRTDIHKSMVEESCTDKRKSMDENIRTDIHKSMDENIRTDIHKSMEEESHTDIHKSLDEERHTDTMDARDSDSEELERDNIENGNLDDEEETDQEENEEESNEFESLSMEDQIKYNELVEAGRLYCTNRQYEEAQACVLQALEILPDEDLQATSVSLQKKIMKKRQKAMIEQQRA